MLPSSGGIGERGFVMRGGAEFGRAASFATSAGVAIVHPKTPSLDHRMRPITTSRVPPSFRVIVTVMPGEQSPATRKPQMPSFDRVNVAVVVIPILPRAATSKSKVYLTLSTKGSKTVSFFRSLLVRFREKA